MLIIKTMFNLICIPDNIPYSIYTDDYLIDKEGNRSEYSDKVNLDCYEYGDLYIDTESVTYKFCKIYACFQWAAWLNEKIADGYAYGNRNVVIDMSKLGKISNEEFNAQLIVDYKSKNATE